MGYDNVYVGHKVKQVGMLEWTRARNIWVCLYLDLEGEKQEVSIEENGRCFSSKKQKGMTDISDRRI